MLATVNELIAASEDELLRLQTALVALPALGPDNGGQGEAVKAAFLYDYARTFAGVTAERIAAPDSRVESGQRPSLVIRRPGRTTRTLWLIAHTDVVPTGDLELWSSDPFVLRRDKDTIYGRGVEDNHQGMVSALLLLRALELANAQTDLSLGLLLVADEETGNQYGMEYILENHPHLFNPEDLILVPDFGTATGEGVEVAEKSVLWLKFTVQGRQCHASTPHQGSNSLVACADLILKLDKLGNRFAATDELFDPPHSTFVPSKKEANVPNINTLPGQDVVYLDCRVLPHYDLEDILREVRMLCTEVERDRNVRVTMDTVIREQAATGTPAQAPVVQALSEAIAATRGTTARLLGIGGGTVAACFRKRGLPAACWATLHHMAHQPNESSSIANTLADAATFAHLLFHGARER